MKIFEMTGEATITRKFSITVLANTIEEAEEHAHSLIANENVNDSEFFIQDEDVIDIELTEWDYK